jgi:alkanesulfonate monooxygenase SsuD/methylene tetrahydromethanopterin reductase-like flavin-dependent oxidoreductase (luciferase family)
MEFAVQTRERSVDGFVEVARWADETQLAALAVADHYLPGIDGDDSPMYDSPVLLGALAQATEHIELQTLVSPITFRHPAVLAKTAATLQEISHGRFVLGVGTGWMEREHSVFGLPFPERSERFAMLEESLAYLRAAFEEPPQDFSGRRYSFTGIDHRPRPPLRIVVGGSGRECTPRLAGTYADEFNLVGTAPTDVPERVERARAAAADAGRDPDSLLISAAGVLVTGETREEYRAGLGRIAGLLGREPAALEEALALRDAPHGTYEQVRDGLGRMADGGIRRFTVQVIGGLDVAATERLLAAMD